MVAHVLKIEIPTGDKNGALRIINQLIAKLADPGLMSNIGLAELPVIRERFVTKTAPDGSAWAANAPLTLMLARGGSMMRRSGDLMGSVQFNLMGYKLSIGPNKKYAKLMQFGGKVEAKNGAALAIPVPSGTKMTRKQADDLGVEQKKVRGKKGDGVAATKTAGVIFVKSVTVPARPYIGIGEKDSEAIMNAVEDWFSVQ